MSQLLKNMMVNAGIEKGNPLNPKRAAMAEALTRTYLNQVMPEIKATLQQVEAMKSQPATKGDATK
jgi:hypothetical protein